MTQQPEPRTGWNGVWRERMRLHRACTGEDPAAFWDKPEAARRYWRASCEQEEARRRIERTVRELDARPGDRVLDVGAGPGALAVPLARAGCRVTAVEPARAMMAVLQENAERLGLRDVRCVERRWEEVDPRTDLRGPYRRVVCFAALAMEDLEAAIRKMERVCDGTVHLYWFAGTPSWDALPLELWPRLHGAPYHPMPRGDVLAGVLHDMGIRPEVSHFPFRNRSTFAGVDDALATLAPRYRARNARQRSILREALEAGLKTHGSGRVLEHTATCVHVWWDPQGP